jgi:tetratricopeptide (TPR) repeat protein
LVAQILILKKFIAMKSLHLVLAFILLSNLSLAQTAEELFAEGKQLRTDKKSAEAIKKFQQAVNLKPDYYEASYEMGWCMNDTKDYTGALSTLRKARVGWSHIPKVWFELGYAFDKLNMIDSAVKCYTKCLALKPDYSLAYKQLGTVEYTKDNFQNAVDHWKKFIDIKGGVVDDYLFWYRMGFCHNALKDYTKALEYLKKSEELKKDYLNTYLEMGFASSRLKKNDDAIAYYNKAITVDPNSHVPYNGIAEVYRDNIKDCNKAMEWYRKSFDVKPKERKACFGFGYCMNSQGRYSEAISYLKTAIEQESDYTAAYTELGYAYYMTGNNADALTNLNKSISLNPAGANPYYYAALVYIAQKNKTKAQEMANGYKKAGKDISSLQQKINAL